MQREVNINKTRPQYLWILCCNKMTFTVFTSLRQNTTFSDVTRNTFNMLKRYWPGPRLIFFMGQIWSKNMFLNLWLDTTIMELSPDNLKIFMGVLPPVLVLQKHPKKSSQTFSFKKMLDFFFFPWLWCCHICLLLLQQQQCPWADGVQRVWHACASIQGSLRTTVQLILARSAGAGGTLPTSMQGLTASWIFKVGGRDRRNL